MDDFVSIFGKSVREMGSSPILLMAGLAVGVLSLPVLAGYGKFDEITKSIAVNYSQLVLPLLIMPFITGGALGYAVEVRNKGTSSMATFMDTAMKNYVKMVMAGVISFAVFYFLITGVALLLLTGVAASPFMGSILGFLALGLAFLCLLSIEFYDICIVADGSGAIASFKNSIEFVKRNLPAAAGFFIIAVVLKALVQLPISFGLAGAMMANESYMALVGANASMNVTEALSLAPVTLGMGALLTVAVFQILIQGFVFSFLALFKAELYLALKNRKKITDFDYDFSADNVV
ncbi:hypothetical protein Mtc_0167 [Methanocella conradii HZ254]|uniref:DUF7847 domain-containing protein n=1 Tax=Methanocella conradii (strain DSM 24694 / JCM 17849 / CGMCC 1.5162 / HZ254) TaxID=1041930 RepID=H8I6P6_METCZ|nr:hypothetical protein [Methanocella conradii]AFC98938.1 hypothetical protein Mtc_0167 [Methanocella conradii HZ254]